MKGDLKRQVSIGLLGAVLIVPAASAAQGRGREDRPRQDQPRESPRSGQAPGARPEWRAVPREQVQPPRYEAPRNQPPRDQTMRYSPPAYSSGSRSYGPRFGAPRYSPRYGPPARYDAPRYVVPYRYGPRPVYRPYYVFQPRVRISFGLFLGHPVAFPPWYTPYAPGAYRYYRPGVAYGGVSFDIHPYDAAVYVDGEYVGTADDFSPVRPPLTLPAGRHRIDLDAPRFAPLSFDITVLPGQVMPYHGSLGR